MSRLLWAHGAGIEGMGGRRPRVARRRTDPRRPQRRAPRGRTPLRGAVEPPLAVPHRRTPEGGAPQGAVPPLDRPRVGVGVATITEPDQLDAIASKLIWTDDYAASRFRWKKRDPLWVLALRVHRLAEPVTVPWREEYGGCTSWVDLDGLPDDPTALASEPALSDVAFDARMKGAVEALPSLGDTAS